MACQKIGYERVAGIMSKNRWKKWRSMIVEEYAPLGKWTTIKWKRCIFYGKNLVIYDPYIIYPVTYHIHCSILRMIGASHFPVLCGHFPSLRMCAYRISVYGPHLQVTPLGGCQEWWATLFTGLVLEMRRTFPLRIRLFFCEEIPWLYKGNRWLVSHYDKALFLGGHVEGNRLTSHNYWCFKPIWQQTKN